ncbi:MAG: hypothetical protein RLZ45_2756 [Verrucomicrobiota bacterium]
MFSVPRNSTPANAKLAGGVSFDCLGGNQGFPRRRKGAEMGNEWEGRGAARPHPCRNAEAKLLGGREVIGTRRRRDAEENRGQGRRRQDSRRGVEARRRGNGRRGAVGNRIYQRPPGFSSVSPRAHSPPCFASVGSRWGREGPQPLGGRARLGAGDHGEISGLRVRMAWTAKAVARTAGSVVTRIESTSPSRNASAGSASSVVGQSWRQTSSTTQPPV